MRKRFSLPKVLAVTVLAGAGAAGCGPPAQVTDSVGAPCDGGTPGSCLADCSSSCGPTCDGDCVYVQSSDPDAGTCECLA